MYVYIYIYTYTLATHLFICSVHWCVCVFNGSILKDQKSCTLG